MLWPLRAAERLKMRGVLRRLMPRALREWIDLVPELTGVSPAYPEAASGRSVRGARPGRGGASRMRRARC